MALQALRESISPLQNHLWHLAQGQKGTPEKPLLATYEADLVKFMHLGNRWNVVFSARFNEAIQRHIWTHEAIAHRHSEVQREHWPFLFDVFQNFDQATREALWDETLGIRSPIQGGRFELEPWSSEELNEKGIKAFFEANLDKWQRWKTTAK